MCLAVFAVLATVRPAQAQLSVPGLTATANGPTQIDLSWTAPSLPSGVVILGYGIEVSPSGTANTWTELVADTGDSATTYSHTGLTAGTTRYYRIDYVNTSHGQATYVTSDVASATTGAATAPGAPTGLRARAKGKTRIEVSWRPPTDTGGSALTGYKIEASPSGAVGTWTTLVADTGGTGTRYLHTKLTAGTTRYYQVFGINAVGTSDASTAASATTAPAGAPGPPTGLTATEREQTRINLSWAAPSGNAPTGYKIEVSPSGTAGTWTTLEFNTGSTGTTYSHIGLAPQTTRHYRVSAVNAAGTGDPSNQASAKTRPGIGAIQIEALAGGLRASWGSTGATSYQVHWRRTVGSEQYHDTRSAQTAATAYNITGLTPGTEYSVRVRSLPSRVRVADAAVGTPLLGKVSGVTAAGASRTSVQVGWTAAAGAQSYAVQWKSGGQDWSGDRQATTTATSYTITSLTAGTSYTVRVQARRSGISPGAWSDEASATTTNLTATSVSTASATLNVTGHPDPWYYKYTSPSGGTCSAAQRAASADVTGLKAAQDYTFATYSDGLCSSMVASVSFSTTSEPLTDLTATPVGATLVVRWKSDGQARRHQDAELLGAMEAGQQPELSDPQ